MSTLGFILPSQQYIPLEHYAHNFHPPSFIMEPHCAAHSPALTQSSSPPTTYAPSFSPGSTLLHPSPGLGQRRSSGVHEQTPGQPFQPLRSPYEVQQTSSHAGYASGGYSAAPSASPALSSTSSHAPSFVAPAPGNLGQEAGGAAYGSNYPGSTPQYAGSGYNVGYAPLPGPSQLYMPPPRQTYPPPYRQGSIAAEAATAPAGGEVPVKVINSRPKPQCWDHGCNGRQFSTFSNLLRHQREKSGTATKSYCPRCGAEFTRTTAMKGHMAHDKCKRANTSEAG